jgi:hypothetical protein
MVSILRSLIAVAPLVSAVASASIPPPEVRSLINSYLDPNVSLSFKEVCKDNKYPHSYTQLLDAILNTFCGDSRHTFAKPLRESSLTLAMSTSQQSAPMDRLITPTHSSGFSRLERTRRPHHYLCGSREGPVYRPSRQRLERTDHVW